MKDTKQNKASAEMDQADECSRIPKMSAEEAKTALQKVFTSFGLVTESGCVQIGDALSVLSECQAREEYFRLLRQLRITPLAARHYQSISKNALLRKDCGTSNAIARPDELARLAGLPTNRLSEILSQDTLELTAADRRACAIVAQYHESMAMDDACRYGWPQIVIRPGETWLVTVIPAKLGIQQSYWARAGLHDCAAGLDLHVDGMDTVRNAYICPRITDPQLGGNPGAHCPGCDHQSPTSVWAMYCLIFEISNESGDLETGTHSPNEPLLLLLRERPFNSVVSAFLQGMESDGVPSMIYLSLDEEGYLVCDPAGGHGEDRDVLRKWTDWLQVPGELRVSNPYRLREHARASRK